MKKESTIKVNKNLIYVGVALVVIIAAVILFSMESKTNDIPQTATDDSVNAVVTPTETTTDDSVNAVVTPTNNLKILYSEIELDKADDKHRKIAGRIQNMGTTKATSVQITAKVYDSKNNLVATEFTRPRSQGNDLMPNEAAYFEINFYIPISSYTLSTSSL